MNWKMHVSINESTNVIFTCMKELKNMRKSLVLSMKLYGHVLLCPSFLLETFIPLSQPLLGWAFCDFNSAGVDWIWAGWDRPISDAAGVVNPKHIFEAQLIGNWATSMAKQLSDDWWVDDIHQTQNPLCSVVSVLLVAAGILLI